MKQIPEFEERKKINKDINTPKAATEEELYKNIKPNSTETNLDNAEIDPRYKELRIKLTNSNELEKEDKIQEQKNALLKETPVKTPEILNLWKPKSLEEVLSDPLFYEKTITQPTLLTEEELTISLKKKHVPQEIIDKLTLVKVNYRGFDNQIHQGQIVIHKYLENSIQKIFQKIFTETNFPITSVFPISMFNWNSSSKLNNCGAFDWRYVDGNDEISDHAFGAAIDINTVPNPYIKEGLQSRPYDPNKKGTLHDKSDVVKIFEEE
jgi:hypothetical protein